MIFGNYTAPEGTKLYTEHCRLAVEYLFEKNPPQLPEYVCTPQFDIVEVVNPATLHLPFWHLPNT